MGNGGRVPCIFNIDTEYVHAPAVLLPQDRRLVYVRAGGRNRPTGTFHHSAEPNLSNTVTCLRYLKSVTNYFGTF